MLNRNPATHPQETTVQVLEKPQEHRARSTWVIHWQHRVHLHNQQAGCTLESHYLLCRLGWTRNILEFWSEAFWNSQQHWSTSAQSMWPSPYTKPRKTELLLRWSRQGRNRRSRFPDPPLLLLPAEANRGHTDLTGLGRCLGRQYSMREPTPTMLYSVWSGRYLDQEI